MKKRISLLTIVLILMLGLAGCGSAKQAELSYDEAQLTEKADTMLEMLTQLDKASIDEIKGMSGTVLEMSLYQTGLPVSQEDFIGMVDGWESGLKECGAYKDHGDYVVKASNTKVTLTAQGHFAEKDAELTFVFDKKLDMTDLTVNTKYSVGEILAKAGKNTVIGMGTVFIVLIFISFIISLLKYVPALFAVKKMKPEAAVKEAVVPAVPVVESVTDDTELVAVITAAIAASEGTPADGFVVRSIKRRKNNKWAS